MEKFVESFGMGWSIFALILLAVVAIGNIFIKNGKNDADLGDEAKKEEK